MFDTLATPTNTTRQPRSTLRLIASGIVMVIAIGTLVTTTPDRAEAAIQQSTPAATCFRSGIELSPGLTKSLTRGVDNYTAGFILQKWDSNAGVWREATSGYFVVSVGKTYTIPMFNRQAGYYRVVAAFQWFDDWARDYRTWTGVPWHILGGDSGWCRY